MAKLFHPLLPLIRLRSRLGGGVHTKAEERRRMLLFGKALGRAINELITIVSPSTVSLTDCYGFAANRRCSSINGASSPESAARTAAR